jgi:hypothetical protein
MAYPKKQLLEPEKPDALNEELAQEICEGLLEIAKEKKGEIQLKTLAEFLEEMKANTH